MSANIFRNFSYYMLANLLPTLVGFVMLPIYSRYLTPEDYGLVALVLSFQSFLPLLMALQIPSSIGRFYFIYQGDSIKLRTYISTIYLITLALSSIVFVTIFINLDAIISLLFPHTTGHNHLFALGIINSFVSLFVSFSTSLLRIQQRAKLLMKTSMTIFCIALLVNIVEIILLQRGARGILEATFITSGVSLGVFTWLIKDSLILRFDPSMLYEPLKYSLPLIPHALSGLIFMYSDRFILEKFVSLNAIGIYMFSDKIAMYFKMVVNEFNNAFSPHFNEIATKSIDQARIEARDISKIVNYFICMAVAATSLFSVELVYFIFDSRYFSAWALIPILSSSYVFRSLFCFSSSVLFFQMKTLQVMMITVVAGVANIILNLLLIPWFGITAAACSTIISFILTFVLSEALSSKNVRIGFSFREHYSVIIYMYFVIAWSLYANRNFHAFGTFDYLCKTTIFFFGLWLGFKRNLLHPKSILSLTGFRK